MSITVGKLFGNGTVLYQMKLLAGQKGLNNSEGWLLEYAQKLYSVGASAFVVNLGPHTKSISDNVINYCNEVRMPLYTIPWETRMVNVTRDICSRILQKEQVEASKLRILY